MLSAESEDLIPGTRIPWQIVETDFRAETGITAKFGPNKRVKAIDGANGFISACYILYFDWPENSQHLPEKALFKIVDGVLNTKRANDVGHDRNPLLTARNFHDTELDFLRRIRAYSEFTDAVPLPTLFCGREFDFNGQQSGYAVMQFFDDIHNRVMYHTVGARGRQQAVQIIARITAFSVKNQDFVQSLGCAKLAEAMTGWGSIQQLTDSCKSLYEPFPDKRAEIDILISQTKYFESPAKLFKTLLSTSKVPLICHGDYWPGNILWNKEADDEYTVRAVVDWQLLHAGSSLFDIARFLPIAMNPTEYRSQRDFYLKMFWDETSRHLDGHPMPWDSYDEFVKQFEITQVIVTTLFLPIFFSMTTFFDTPQTDEKVRQFEEYHEKTRARLDEVARIVKKWNL